MQLFTPLTYRPIKGARRRGEHRVTLCVQRMTKNSAQLKMKNVRKIVGGGTTMVPYRTPRRTLLRTVADNETAANSGYANNKFVKQYLYSDYRKISRRARVNKTFKNYLGQFDVRLKKNRLERTFKQCYYITNGSVQKSLNMMKTIETDAYASLPGIASSEVWNDAISVMPCKAIGKPVEMVKKKKHLKSMSERLTRLLERVEQIIQLVCENDERMPDTYLNNAVP